MSLPSCSMYAALIAVFLAAPATAQELQIPPAIYPALPQTAADAAGFAPQGWVLDAQAQGDLNRDGLPDLLFVLRDNNPDNVIDASGMGPAEFNTNPRMLGVAFRDGSSYALKLENHTLIPRNDNPTMEDPFDREFPALAIERGAFSVTLGNFSNAGSWEMGNAKLIFRWQNGRFELIGWDRSSVKRNSGETEDKSANFSTGVLEIATGNIASDANKVVKKKLKIGLLPIDAVGDGLVFGSGAEGSPDIR